MSGQNLDNIDMKNVHIPVLDAGKQVMTIVYMQYSILEELYTVPLG